MKHWRILTIIFTTFIVIEAKHLHQQKRETKANICDSAFNSTNKIQCYCAMSNENKVNSADCYPTVDGVAPNDPSWDSFDGLKDATSVVITNTKGNHINYIPTHALKHTKRLSKLDIKYGIIDRIDAFAFGNLSTLEEIYLRDNQISVLKINAFAHHRNLKTINLDMNSVVEINRDVFIDLPALEKLYLTSNKITTIHDRAFVHLTNLRELEIDRNNIFSLNSESFSGLKNLNKLDLSSNSLEVIGDNTFLPLTKLEILNLDGNNIQMIDERGFNGLSNLQALSLAHNALQNLDNVKIFQGLTSLTSLSLKANELQELKKDVIAPLLNNLYSQMASLDIEDINFPCDCRLDWLMSLRNVTKSEHLKQSLENLKCVPDLDLRIRYNNSEQMYEDEQDKAPKNSGAAASDYEFYDDTQLDGKLFYSDLNYLLNCSDNSPHGTKLSTSAINPAVMVTTPKARPQAVQTPKSISIANKGLLDLSYEEMSKTEPNKATDANSILVNEGSMPANQGIVDKKDSYTTNRLATVSAKPTDIKYEERDMASDEAKPDTLKYNKNNKDDIEGLPMKSGANIINIYRLTVLVAVVLINFYYS